MARDVVGGEAGEARSRREGGRSELMVGRLRGAAECFEAVIKEPGASRGDRALADGGMVTIWGAQKRSPSAQLEWLQQHNEPSLYDRVLIPNYAHIDCIFGKSADKDVFPHIVEHLDKTR